MKYKLVASGGTFDHFHKGHRQFIKAQLELSQKILLGITSDTFVDKNKPNEQIQDFKIRKKAIEELIRQEKATNRVQISSIDTIYIPSAWQSLPIEAIVVTKETKFGAILINQKRQEEGLPKLNIEILEHVLTEDGKPISSFRIRHGEINRQGRLNIDKHWLKGMLILPEEVRKELKKPFGRLLQTEQLQNKSIDGAKIITVGDITTFIFNQKAIGQKISVIDFIVGRKKQFSEVSELGFNGSEEIIKIINQAGTINPQLFKLIKDRIGLKKRTIILIDGEEDLAVLNCILTSPLGWVIYYGQPKEGMVEVRVTEEIKEKAYLIVSKFIRKEANNTRGY